MFDVHRIYIFGSSIMVCMGINNKKGGEGMSEFIAFCIGFIVGGLFGVLFMALVVGAKMSRGGEE